jgi:hypothetical protein
LFIDHILRSSFLLTINTIYLLYLQNPAYLKRFDKTRHFITKISRIEIFRCVRPPYFILKHHSFVPAITNRPICATMGIEEGG